MPQVINTNIASLNAQRNLNSSQDALQTAFQRLSSGLRINSAKDDAAGLAISERMTGQIRGLNQAVRNANDGISLAQTAEAALTESTNILQRIRELAVQSANATNSASDRAALQSEVSQLRSELDRIATTSEFNGLKLLDGTFTSQQFQVGANANQTITASVSSGRARDIGAFVNASSTQSQTATDNVSNGTNTTIATQTGGTVNANVYTGLNGTASNGTNITINGTDVLDSSAYVVSGDTQRGATSGFAIAQAINATNIAGINATTTTSKTFSNVAAAGGNNSFATAVGTGITTDLDTADYVLSVNGQQVFTDTYSSTNLSTSIDDVVNAVNQFTDTTGVRATNSSGELTLTADDGRDILIAESFTYNDTTAAGNNTATVDTIFGDFAESADGGSGAATNDFTIKGSVTIDSSATVTITNGADILGLASGGSTSLAAAGSIDTVDISSVSGANNAILSVDAALDTINSSRADLGAIQSRFDSTIANLSAITENLQAARSRIRDADFAQETAELTRTQILQQAGTSILAQANVSQQSVLALLQ